MKKNPAKSLGMFGTGLNSSGGNSSNTTKSRSKPISMSDFIEKSDILKEVKEINDEEENEYKDKQQKTVESKASKTSKTKNFETNVKEKILKTDLQRQKTIENDKDEPQKNVSEDIDD